MKNRTVKETVLCYAKTCGNIAELSHHTMQCSHLGVLCSLSLVFVSERVRENNNALLYYNTVTFGQETVWEWVTLKMCALRLTRQAENFQ